MSDKPVCGFCRKPLPDNGPSEDFCGEPHQGYWYQQQLGKPVPPTRPVSERTQWILRDRRGCD